MLTRPEVKCVPLTEELLKEFVSLQAIQSERTFKKTRTEYLYRTFIAGYYRTFVWVIAKYPDGRTCRINGQHSSKALMLMLDKDKFPKDAWVLLEEWKVENEFDIVSLFAQYDSRKSARTPEDQALIAQKSNSCLDVVNPKLAKVTANALAFYAYMYEKRVWPGAIETYEDYLKDAKYCDFFLLINKHFLKLDVRYWKPFILAAVYHSWRTDGETAAVFWGYCLSVDATVEGFSEIVSVLNAQNIPYMSREYYAKCVKFYSRYSTPFLTLGKR